MSSSWNSRYLIPYIKTNQNLKIFDEITNIPNIHKIYSELFKNSINTSGEIVNTNYDYVNILCKHDRILDSYYFNHKNLIKANEHCFIIEYSKNENPNQKNKIINIINKSLSKGNCIDGDLINELYPDCSTIIFNIHKSLIEDLSNSHKLELDNLICVGANQYQNPFDYIKLFTNTKWFLFEDYNFYKEYYFYQHKHIHFTELLEKILFRSLNIMIEGIMFYIKGNKIFNPPKLWTLKIFEFSVDDDYRWICYQPI
jgi:hypothetical protein